MIVTDALHCQTKTAQVITDKKADYLLKVKDNQKELREEIADYVSEESLRKKMDTSETVEKNRGRTEKRTAYITQNIDWLYDKEKWSKLKSIGAICSTVTHKGKSVTTWHF